MHSKFHFGGVLATFLGVHPSPPKKILKWKKLPVVTLSEAAAGSGHLIIAE